MKAAPTVSIRRAGRAQGIALMAVVAMPTLALAGLVADLPQLFSVFASHPNHALLVPMIITVPSLCVALFSGVAGTLADFWGRRKLLVLALIAFSVLGLMPLLVDGLALIIATRVIIGLAEAAILTVGNALMGDYFEGEERRKWLGYQNMLGPFIGSSILLAGGFLAGQHWRAPFLLYLLGFVVLALVLCFCWEPERKEGERDSTASAVAFPWCATFLVCGTTILMSMVYFVQAVQHGRIFADLGAGSPERISVLVTAASMGTVVGGYLFKRFARLSTISWLSFGLAAYGAAYVGVAWAPNVTVGLPLDAMGQIGGGILLPALIAWALNQYAFEQRGRGMGLWGGCFFLGQFLSPPMITFISQWAGSFLASVAVIGWLCLGASLLLFAAQRLVTTQCSSVVSS
jgi:MFS family permease